MFEQSYREPAPAENLHEGDFLYHYEVGKWDLSPRMYQILGVSTIINVLLLVVFAQTPILTARGCDGPLVGQVCQVLDTVYLGALLFGTEREYADAEYDPTHLNEGDEVTFVDVSNMDAKLDYPGAFVDFSTGQAVPMFAQPDVVPQPTVEQGFLAPGIPAYPMSTTTPGLTDTPQVLPTPNPNSVEGTLPPFDNPTTTTNPTSGPRNLRNPKIRKGNPTVADVNANANIPIGPNPTLPNANTLNANTAAQADESTVDKNGIFINKRPLTDQAKQTIKDIQENKVKLDVPFKVLIEGTLALGPDGKTVVLKDPKQIKDPTIKNDPEMEKLVQNWILRVGDSGWLGYLNQLDQKGKVKSRKVSILVEQNAADFLASIKSEMTSENEAKTAASGLAVILSAGAMTQTGDEQTFLKSATTTTDGNFFVFNFKMATPDVQQMIQRKLAESAKPAEPNGNAATGPNNNAAAKK